MSEQYAGASCKEFAAALASKAPVPGGGGASAMVGALGVALCEMVGNLTRGRKKYAAVEADVCAMLDKAERLRARLLALIEQDARAFEPLAAAYSIPKDDPARGATMERASLDACKAPLDMMRCCAQAIELLDEMRQKGNTGLLSDVGCGALFCKAALAGASMNIYINLRSIENAETAAALKSETDGLLETYGALADKIGEAVFERLKEG